MHGRGPGVAGAQCTSPGVWQATSAWWLPPKMDLCAEIFSAADSTSMRTILVSAGLAKSLNDWPITQASTPSFTMSRSCNVRSGARRTSKWPRRMLREPALGSRTQSFHAGSGVTSDKNLHVLRHKRAKVRDDCLVSVRSTISTSDWAVATAFETARSVGGESPAQQSLARAQVGLWACWAGR